MRTEHYVLAGALALVIWLWLARRQVAVQSRPSPIRRRVLGATGASGFGGQL